jgi:Mce-associated membrane protein
MTATRKNLLAVALFLLAAALVVTGTLLIAHPRAEHSANTAFADRPATTQVVGQVSTALNQVLSYSYSSPQPTSAAASKWLAGDAVGQYRLLFTQLRQRAPGQKLSLVTRVVTAGVSSLQGDTAQLLVFLDQKSTRASDNQSSVAAAQVLITAHRTGSLWKITELKAL